MIKKFKESDEEDSIKILDKNDWGNKKTVKTSSKDSVGYDLRTPEDIVLPPNCEMTVDTNVVVDVTSIEEDVFVCVVPRSSAGGDKDLELQNTMGIIDVDYNGPKDTLKVMLRRRPESYSLVLDETLDPYGEKFEKLIRDPLYDVKEMKMDYTGDVLRRDDYYKLIRNGAFDQNIKNNTSVLGVHVDSNNLKIALKMNNQQDTVSLKVFKGSRNTSPLCYKAGDRFAQMFLCKYEKKALDFVDSLDNHNRGGLGSTGVL